MLVLTHAQPAETNRCLWSPRWKLTVLDLSGTVSGGESFLPGPRMQLVCGYRAQADYSVGAVGNLDGFGFKIPALIECLAKSRT